MGLEVDKKATIRNRYNRIPHPAQNTKREKNTHNQNGTKTKTSQAKSQRDSSFEGQRVFEQRGKKESRAYYGLLKVKWLKEVEPLLCFLIELIQNPNFFRIEIFASNFHHWVGNSCYFCQVLICWFWGKIASWGLVFNNITIIHMHNEE